MLLKFGTPCRSRGEFLGLLWGVSVEAGERLLLRLIVEQPQASPLIRVRVPFGRMDQADADSILLSLSPDEFRACAPHGSEGVHRVKSQQARKRRGEEPAERVLSAAARVYCRDGEIGNLMALGVDGRSGDVLDISFAVGMPLTREVVVPAQHLDEIRDERVALAISMNDVADFPSRRAL